MPYTDVVTLKKKKKGKHLRVHSEGAGKVLDVQAAAPLQRIIEVADQRAEGVIEAGLHALQLAGGKGGRDDAETKKKKS